MNSLEKELLNTCKQLVLQGRGNNTDDHQCKFDNDKVNLLHDQLDSYAQSIKFDVQVNKEVVSLLFYTCTRFYNQSKYANNSSELLLEFEKLYLKIIGIYSLEGTLL